MWVPLKRQVHLLHTHPFFVFVVQFCAADSQPSKNNDCICLQLTNACIRFLYAQIWQDASQMTSSTQENIYLLPGYEGQRLFVIDFDFLSSNAQANL